MCGLFANRASNLRTVGFHSAHVKYINDYKFIIIMNAMSGKPDGGARHRIGSFNNSVATDSPHK